MNKKEVLYISDFFYEDGVRGGCEINDHELLFLLKDKLNITKKRSEEITIKSLKNYDFVIVSNFCLLGLEVVAFIQEKLPYILYEHDHKYVLTRNPYIYKNFKVPEELITFKDFYKNAKVVVCQSLFHKEILEKNLNLKNIVSIGANLWSLEDLDFIEDLLKNGKEKTNKAAVQETDNLIKGMNEALAFCESKGLKHSLIPYVPKLEFFEELSKHNSFVFLPTSPETLSRTIVEARMLELKVYTNDLVGATREPWFGLKGKALIDFMRAKRNEIATFIFEKIEDNKDDEITVILNAYRRPYNLKKQISAIRNQTVKPIQIWLWVNKHEDNANFDFSTLDVDRVVKNDYNWKFYGRFSLALLAGTKYVAIFDDDTIPGKKWFKNCLDCIDVEAGIMGSAGVRLKSDRYLGHDRLGWPVMNSKLEEVDLVGHAWFFKRDWLKYLWMERPLTWDNGEDIQFSYLAQKYGNIKTFCPPHPEEDKEMHGSILGNELGIDDKATSTNSTISHLEFFSQRDYCIQSAIKSGWKTVRNIKLR